MMYVGKPHHQLIEDLLEMHAAYVDAQELAVPTTAVEACASDKGINTAPHLARAIIMTLWAPEAVIPKQRTPPDTANLLSQTEIFNLAKNETLVVAAEGWLANTREGMTPLLQQDLLRNEALEIPMAYEVALVRLIFGKKISHLGWSFPQGFTTGNCTEHKHTALLAGRLEYFEKKGKRHVLLPRNGRGGPHLDIGVVVRKQQGRCLRR